MGYPTQTMIKWTGQSWSLGETVHLYAIWKKSDGSFETEEYHP